MASLWHISRNLHDRKIFHWIQFDNQKFFDYQKDSQLRIHYNKK